MKIGNCFKTKAEAEAVLEKIKIYTQLKRLAEEINTEPIDWGNGKQRKYCIICNEDNILAKTWDIKIRTVGNVHSTNENFLDIALERIGEENLLKLFKE